MRTELRELLENLGIDISDSPIAVDVSAFCSKVSKKVLTDCEVRDTIKSERLSKQVLRRQKGLKAC